MTLSLVKFRPYKYRAGCNITTYNRAQLYTGAGFDFNGTTSKINIPQAVGSVKSIALWINPDSVTTSLLELTGSASVSIASGVITTSGITSPTIYVNNQTTENRVITGKWQFIVITTETAIVTTGTSCNIGSVSTGFYDGKISNVQFFGNTLTESQILSLYQNPEYVDLESPAMNLLLWYPMAGNNSSPIYIFNAASNKIVGVPTALTATTGHNMIYQVGRSGYNKKQVFDGVDDYISIGNISNSTTFALTFKVVIDAFGTTVLPFQIGNYSIAFKNSTTITVSPDGAAGTDIALGTVLLTKKLYTFYIAQSGTTVSIRIQAGVGFSGTVAAVSTTSTASYIGRSGANYFKGFIDQVAVFSAFLNTADLTALFNSTPIQDLTATPTFYWQNTNGTWVNEANPGTNDGTPNGTPTAVLIPEGLDGDCNNCPLIYANTGQLQLDAYGYGIVKSNQSLELTTSVSVECWVYVNSLSTYYLVYKNQSYSLDLTSGGLAQFRTYSGGAWRTLATVATIAAGQWYHVCGTYTTAETKIYLNGALSVSTGSYTGAVNSNTNDVYLGSDGSTSLSGKIDDAKIYNKVLNASEVLANYRAGLSQFT
jgi:hypothetical protein